MAIINGINPKTVLLHLLCISSEGKITKEADLLLDLCKPSLRTLLSSHCPPYQAISVEAGCGITSLHLIRG